MGSAGTSLSRPGPPAPGAGGLEPIGSWLADDRAFVAFDPDELSAVASEPRLAAHVVFDSAAGRVGAAVGGRALPGEAAAGAFDLLATLPPLYPEWLGDRSFCEAHGVRYPYVCGEMANGIATTRMVVAMADAGMLGFFGAAGLQPARVAAAVDELRARLGPERAWGVNLIHSPGDLAREDRIAELVVASDVPCVSASAFMTITPAVVRCAVAGLRTDASGGLVRGRRLFAKLSRPELAERFLSPAPDDLLALLVERAQISEEEARLARLVPLAEDVTVEADSGGHTDNRPLAVLVPAMLAVRDQVAARHERYPRLRIGAAGGLGDPAAVAAAFALGADYVLTGSVNQAAVESGVSDDAKALLCAADFHDVAMAPSADMFELGVKVQVLKRGSLYAARAGRLYDVYQRYDSIDTLPVELRARLETEIFRMSLEEAWEQTRAYWALQGPAELEHAEASPRHRMALLFRWYLGLSSRWAIDGLVERQADYQLWCGPAIGAFNRWVRGSFLAAPAARTVVQIARNLLEGAAAITRAQQLRSCGANVGAAAFRFVPRPLD